MAISLKWQGSHFKKGRQEAEALSYDCHRWKSGEMVLEGAKCIGIAAAFSWFFYRSVPAMMPMGIVSVWLCHADSDRKAKEDRRMLTQQFSDCIRCVSASMSVGYSIENAFAESLADMRMMYGENAFICDELERVRRGLAVNVSLEELLSDFGERSHVGVIREFAEGLSIAKRVGGNILSMIHASADMIRRKAEAEAELYTLTAARRMEQSIMNVMPFGIVLYLECTNPGYFDTLYHNIRGNAIMSVCLILYLAAYLMSEKILEKTCANWE